MTDNYKQRQNFYGEIESESAKIFRWRSWIGSAGVLFGDPNTVINDLNSRVMNDIESIWSANIALIIPKLSSLSTHRSSARKFKPGFLLKREIQ